MARRSLTVLTNLEIPFGQCLRKTGPAVCLHVGLKKRLPSTGYHETGLRGPRISKLLETSTALVIQIIGRRGVMFGVTYTIGRVIGFWVNLLYDNASIPKNIDLWFSVNH